MKIKRFKHLKDKKLPDFNYFVIVKERLIPKLHLTFEDVASGTFKYMIKNNLGDKYPIWEVSLNALTRDYGISEDTLTEAMKEAILEQREEDRINLNQLIEKYHKVLEENKNKLE